MILFCATDAGGAKELIPVIRVAERQHLPSRILSSAVTAPLFAQAGIAAETLELASSEEAEAYMRVLEPQELIVSTTGTIKNERHLTEAARHMGIRSTAVLDEWYNYALRFTDEKADLTRFLPDIICVQDERSKALAVGEGLPEERVRITGSPALAELSRRAREYALHPPPVPETLRDSGDRVSLLFLSEGIRAVYGDRADAKGAYGSFFGFHEDIVRAHLAQCLTHALTNVLVLEKLHPSEGWKSPPETGGNVTWRILKGSELLEPLLWHADVIIGMCSKALLEAAVLGRKPLSYQPNVIGPPRGTAAGMGFAELHTRRESFEARLPTLLQKRPAHPHSFMHLSCAPPEAAARVLALARGLVADA